MSEPGIRAVFFDAVGTLILPEPSAVAVYAEVGRRHGSQLEAADIRRRFLEAFRRQEQLDRQTGWRTDECREMQRWRTIVGEVMVDVPQPEACFRELYEHFAQPASWRCAAESGRMLEVLSRRGCALGLASNYDERLRRVLAGMPELAAIRNIVISSEVGWRKPSPHFFDAMCRQVGLTAHEVLFVGDDPENDYEGALAVGCRAVLFDPTGKAAPTVRRITAWKELPAVLDKPNC
jgi:putative hydrolase of the HAD superfamily